MLKGSCLCGAIQYEIDGSLQEMGHCHCSMCRKFHGAAFGTYVNVRDDDFRFVSGEDQISEYRSSPQVVRTFCKVCGSPLQWVPEGHPGFGLAAGTLDSDPGIKPVYQIWTSSKAPWWDLQDGLQSYETEPSDES